LRAGAAFFAAVAAEVFFAAVAAEAFFAAAFATTGPGAECSAAA
jgi:hypothetical protein